MAENLKTYCADELLFSQGDPSDSLIFIKEGEVEIFVESDGVKVVFATMKPGEVIGTVTLFNKEPRTANARAIVETQVQVIPNDSARKGLDTVPPWIQSIVKDAIARLRHVNSQLLESRKQLKQLEKNQETVFSKAAKVSALLFALAKTGVMDFEGTEVFPVRNFEATAEGVLGEPAENVLSIYKAFVKSGLVREFPTQKFGPSIQKERFQILNDFAIFLRKLSKNPERQFVPIKYQPLLLGFPKIAVTNPDKKVWETAELSEAVKKQTGKDLDEEALKVLIEKGVLSPGKGTEISFSASAIQKRNIFEATWREVKEVALKA